MNKNQYSTASPLIIPCERVLCDERSHKPVVRLLTFPPSEFHKNSELSHWHTFWLSSITKFFTEVFDLGKLIFGSDNAFHTCSVLDKKGYRAGENKRCHERCG